MANEVVRIRCECGWETSGTEDEVVTATKQHGKSLHNMDPTREQVLAMAVAPEG